MEELFIILALILLNGVFAMSEVSLISARKAKLLTDVKQGKRSAKVALDLANQPDRFLSTVQIGITLIGLLTGIFSGNKIAHIFSDLLLEWGIPSAYAGFVSQTLIVVLVTFFSILLGELVPKRIGMASAEKVACVVARPMKFLSKITYPFVWLLSRCTSFIFSLFGFKEEDNKVTEEEIKTMIQEGTEDGEVQPVEQDIVRRVFLMGDLKVASIMTHKNDVVSIDVSADAEGVQEIIKSALYEFYPVIDGDFDHLVGVISLKDLVMCLNQPDFNLSKLVHEPTFFHENMSVYKALEMMKQKGLSRALVCDEFGTCVGIITLKDILQGLVGNIDNHDEEPDIVKRLDNSWLVSGQTTVVDFLTYFDSCDLLEDSDYNTVAGLIMHYLESIPKTGQTVVWKGFKMEVVDMDGVRVDKVLVTKVDETGEA